MALVLAHFYFTLGLSALNLRFNSCRSITIAINSSCFLTSKSVTWQNTHAQSFTGKLFLVFKFDYTLNL